MIKVLKDLLPEFSHFEESILSKDGSHLGHQCVLVLKSGYPFAGGTDADLNVARRICAAEAIERSYVVQAKDQGEAATSCGFAAGFEEKPTIFRAICEAVERWAWSKWIDDRRATQPVSLVTRSPLEDYFASVFAETVAFDQPLLADSHLWPNFVQRDLMFNAVIGRAENGIFLGSRVTTSTDKRWEHALLEAWRHKSIFFNELLNSTPTNIFDQRIKFFGQTGAPKLVEICNFQAKPWPQPKLSILKEVANRDGYYVWRAFCEDYLPWERGDVDRLIY